MVMYCTDRPNCFAFEDEADLKEWDVNVLVSIPKTKTVVSHVTTSAFDTDPCGFTKLKIDFCSSYPLSLSLSLSLSPVYIRI